MKLTDAAQLSHKVQSSLILNSTPKSKTKNDYDLKNVLSLVSIGCIIGYTLNHIYNKYTNNKTDTDYFDDENDENITEYHKKRIAKLTKSQNSLSLYTLPPYYAKHIYNKSNDTKTQTKSTKSISSLFFTPKKKKKTKKSIYDIYEEKQIILNQIKKQLFQYQHSTKRNLLLISNESDYAYKQIKQFLDKNTNNLLVIPFGHEDWDENAKYMEQKMWEIGKKCVSIHSKRNMIKLIGQSDAIIIPDGGNTYRLLYWLYHYNLMYILQTVINDGMPFIGIGNGVNIVGLTIQTCFYDIAIVQPPTFKALSIIPFQLISKYNESYNDDENYHQQIRMFLKENKDYKIAVLALYENCCLVIRNNKIRLNGNGSKGNGCMLYRDYKSEREQILIGGLLSSLLGIKPY